MRLFAVIAVLALAASAAFGQGYANYDHAKIDTLRCEIGIFETIRTYFSDLAIAMDNGDIAITVDEALTLETDSGFTVAGPVTFSGGVTQGVVDADTVGIGDTSTEYPLDIDVASGDFFAYLYSTTGAATALGLDTDDATAEVGLTLLRQGTALWRLEDSNGTFILYDVDDTQNVLQVNATSGLVTIPNSLTVTTDATVGGDASVTGDLSLTGNVTTDLVAPTYNFVPASDVTGGADSIVVDFDPDLLALTAGSTIEFVAEAANTGNADIYVDGVQKDIYEASDVSELEAGDIANGAYVILKYDGTQFQQVSQSGN